MNLCYNCFKEKPEGNGPCPYCGFDLEENVKKYPVTLRAGTILNGRYMVGRVLGQGGFGITYLAWDESLKARVAVKEYMPNEMAARVGTTVSVAMKSRAEDFAYGLERFQEEARTLAKFMGQPNIAGVTDYFDENGTSYFVMDYIEGISFKTYIANQGGKVSPEEALDVLIPVLRALTAVHAEGFIHRDVTPDNIYITKDGNVKLLDFGSARYSLGDKSKSLDVVLKVGYAPKEQYTRRGRQGPYTDVYSCAACLYAAITGYLPPESLERLDHDELVPPSQMGVEIPLYLERAILKGLAVQLENRFQTAGEFLEALESQEVVELPPEKGQGAGTGADSQAAGSQGQTGPQQAQLKSPAQPKKSLLAKIAAAAAVAAVAFAAVALVVSRNPSDGPGGKSGTGVVGQGESGAGGQNGAAQPEAPIPTVTIAGEEYPVNLEELDLSGKGLADSDMANLGQMTELKSLNLEGNPDISDLTALAGLTVLEELKLPSPSQISDLSPLSGLTGLTSLSMVENWGKEQQPLSMIQDYSSLAGLTGLKELSLSVTNLGDFSFLDGMNGLETLRLVGSVVTEDLTYFGKFTNLKELRVYTANLKSVEGIEGLQNLEYLRITEVDEQLFLDDLTFLENMKGLQYLRLDIYGVGSLHGLEGLTKLETLQFSWPRVSTYTDLSPLENLTNLQILTLPIPTDDTEVIYHVDSLAGLTNLSELRLPCVVESLEPLKNMTSLQTLTLRGGSGDLARKNMESLSQLSGLENLTTLELYPRYSGTVDLTPVGSLTHLTSLNVYTGDSRSVDLSPLAGLPGLASLSVNGEAVADWPPS
mgnify:FL=1